MDYSPKPLYETALRIDSRCFQALHGLGFCSLRADDPVSAVSYFDRALAIDPTDFPSLYGATKARARLGRCDEAAAFAERYREQRADSGHAQERTLELSDLVKACREDAGLTVPTPDASLKSK